MKYLTSLVRKTISRLLDRKKIPKVQTNKVTREIDGFSVSVDGVPSTLTSSEQRQVLLFLLKSSIISNDNDKVYEKGEVVARGEALLDVQGTLYTIKYSIDALRTLYALTAYKDAFDTVQKGVQVGRFDPVLGELAVDFLRSSAWEEINRLGFRKIRIKLLTGDYQALPRQERKVING